MGQIAAKNRQSMIVMYDREGANGLTTLLFHIINSHIPTPRFQRK